MSAMRARMFRALLESVEQLDLLVSERQVEALAYEVTRRLELPVRGPLIKLTPRQRDILTGMAAGESVRQTARRLCVEESTIRSHRRALYQRLEVSSSGAAVARAVAWNLMDGEVAP